MGQSRKYRTINSDVFKGIKKRERMEDPEYNRKNKEVRKVDEFKLMQLTCFQKKGMEKWKEAERTEH